MIKTTYQNLWDVVMVVFKEKFILLRANIKKEDLKLNDLNFHIKELEKKSRLNSKQKGGHYKCKNGNQ